MVTEPLEALIAILLISIILASIFIYNQRGTESITQMGTLRALSRSIAGTVAELYLNYTNSSITFREFNESANNFLEYVEKKENVRIAANITVVLKNGTLKTARLRQVDASVKVNKSITENITLFITNKSRKWHAYVLPFRNYVYLYCSLPIPSFNICLSYSYRPIYIYVVGYYSDGTPVESGSASASADKCFSPDQQEIYNGIALLKLSYSECTSPEKNKEIKVTVSYSIGGESPPPIILNLSVKDCTTGSCKNGQLKFDCDCPDPTDPTKTKKVPCHYFYLGEIINLTDVSNWVIQGRRGPNDKCPSSGYGSGNIPTASGSCDSLPRYIFFTPGPYNLSMNSGDTNQPFFIQPYFVIVSVKVSR